MRFGSHDWALCKVPPPERPPYDSILGASIVQRTLARLRGASLVYATIMYHESDIKCPQPTRPLKRKASQLSPSDEADDGHIVSKKAPFFPLLSDRIDKWLTELPHSLDRTASRSDGFLLRKMSKDPWGPSDNNLRPGSAVAAASDRQYPPFTTIIRCDTCIFCTSGATVCLHSGTSITALICIAMATSIRHINCHHILKGRFEETEAGSVTLISR